jgi:HEAT repeats
LPEPSAPLVISASQDAAKGGIQVASVQSIQVLKDEPGAERVQVGFERLVPETMTGSFDNPEIRQLLLKAAEGGAEGRVDPMVRANSFDLLVGACLAGQCNDGPVRNALMYTARHDKDGSVRLKALDGLQPYVADDRNVRNVVLHALMKDPDAHVRMRAIDLLQPVDSDLSVRQALHNVADTDENPYLRTVSRQMLSGLPEIQ